MSLDGERGEKEERKRKRERERGDRDGDVPAGEQMVAPFIGLFAGFSHHVSSSLCSSSLCSSKLSEARSNPAFDDTEGGLFAWIVLGRRWRSAQYFYILLFPSRKFSFCFVFVLSFSLLPSFDEVYVLFFVLRFEELLLLCVVVDTIKKTRLILYA